MNAADERSLEAIRQKIFPFLRASWDMVSVQTEPKPRFIILDECETLTEAAQLSLQTILNKNPQEVCIILICNSQSRIHPKLRQRLLCIRYDPPSAGIIGTENQNQNQNQQRDAFHEITRGDLRLTLKKQDIDERLWFYIHAHPDEILDFLRTTSTDSMTILTELLLLMNLLFILDADILELINQILPLSQANVQMDRILHLVMKVIHMWQLKFEAMIHL